MELAEKSGTQPDVLNKTQLNLARLLRYYVYIFVLVLNQHFNFTSAGKKGEVLPHMKIMMTVNDN